MVSGYGHMAIGHDHRIPELFGYLIVINIAMEYMFTSRAIGDKCIND
jgi:hypothetical protein